MRRRDVYLKIEQLPATARSLPTTPSPSATAATACATRPRGRHDPGRRGRPAPARRARLPRVPRRRSTPCPSRASWSSPTSTSRVGTRRVPGRRALRAAGRAAARPRPQRRRHDPHSFHVHGLRLRHRLGRLVAVRCPGRHGPAQRRDLPRRDVDVHLRRHRRDDRALAVPRPLMRHRRSDEPRPVRRHRRARPRAAEGRLRGAAVLLTACAAARRAAAFDSGTLTAGRRSATPSRSRARSSTSAASIRCSARSRASPADRRPPRVSILDDAPRPRFVPGDVTIGAGGTVTWTHAGAQPHTVSDAGGAGPSTHALNGRTFVGNTPTIVAKSRQAHPLVRVQPRPRHAGTTSTPTASDGASGRTTWSTPGAIGPAESFVVETVVPQVLLPPLDHKHPSGAVAPTTGTTNGKPWARRPRRAT